MIRLVLGLLAAAVIVLGAASALGDILHLKDGRKIEGKILEENRNEVVIETRFGGQRRVEQDRILRIERKRTPKELYETRKKSANEKSADSMYELGQWCKENGLVIESLEAFRKALAVDTNHAEARAALGYVRKDGRWMRKSQAEAAAAAEPDRDRKPDRPTTGAAVSLDTGFLEDAGFEEKNGEWLTNREKAKLKDGLRRYKGRYFPPSVIEKMQDGRVQIGGDWLSYEEADRLHDTWDTAWELSSIHYHITSDWPREEIDNLFEQLEQNYREYARVLGGPPEKPLKIYAFRQHQDYLDFLASKRLSKFSNSDAFFDARSGLVVAHSGKNYSLVRRIIGGVACWQYFKFSYDSAMPGWLAEGISIYFRRFGYDPDGNYVRARPDESRLEHVIEAMETDNVIPIQDLIRLEMFTVLDKGMIKFFSAQSWALVNYLLVRADETTRRDFLRYIDQLRNTFFVMGNAEFIAAQMMEDIFTPEGLKEIERNYLEDVRRQAMELGIIEAEGAGSVEAEEDR